MRSDEKTTVQMSLLILAFRFLSEGCSCIKLCVKVIVGMLQGMMHITIYKQ